MSKRKIKQSAKPWITKAIRRSIKIKKTNYSGNKDKYKLYRNKITNLIRMSKKTLLSRLF